MKARRVPPASPADGNSANHRQTTGQAVPGRSGFSRGQLLAGSVRTAGERLAWLRNAAGLSLTEAATASGISKAELSRLEHGSRRIADRHLLRLAPIYGVQAGELRTLLAFDPTEKTAVLEINETPAPARQRPLPCYSAEGLRSDGPSLAHRTAITAPTHDALGPTAYGVRLPKGTTATVAFGGVVAIADPEARTALGDLAINPIGWAPLIGIVDRDTAGRLVLQGAEESEDGLPAEARLCDLHKVVMLVPQRFATTPCARNDTGEPGEAPDA